MVCYRFLHVALVDDLQMAAPPQDIMEFLFSQKNSSKKRVYGQGWQDNSGIYKLPDPVSETRFVMEMLVFAEVYIFFILT